MSSAAPIDYILLINTTSIGKVKFATVYDVVLCKYFILSQGIAHCSASCDVHFLLGGCTGCLFTRFSRDHATDLVCPYFYFLVDLAIFGETFFQRAPEILPNVSTTY